MVATTHCECWGFHRKRHLSNKREGLRSWRTGGDWGERGRGAKGSEAGMLMKVYTMGWVGNNVDWVVLMVTPGGREFTYLGGRSRGGGGGRKPAADGMGIERGSPERSGRSARAPERGRRGPRAPRPWPAPAPADAPRSTEGPFPGDPPPGGVEAPGGSKGSVAGGSLLSGHARALARCPFLTAYGVPSCFRKAPDPCRSCNSSSRCASAWEDGGQKA